MIMPAIIGTIAQEGQTAGGGGGGGATGVSIATSSSGNYDNAVLVVLAPTGSGGEQGLDPNDGSGFSGGSGTIDLSYGPDYQAQVSAGSGIIDFTTRAYGRATAPSGGNIDEYTWDLDSQSNSISSVGGTPFAVQSFVGTPLSGPAPEGTNDATGNKGVEETVRVTHASGGRGYFLMSVGDHIQWKCQFMVTAGGADVDASAVTIKIDVV